MRIKNFTYFLFFVLLLNFNLLEATPYDAKNEDKIYLVIASYNPDTKRMSDFINSFQYAILAKEPSNKMRLHNMGYKNFNTESHMWCSQMHTIFSAYKLSDIKSIVFLGQEAWAVFKTISDQDSAFAKKFTDIPLFTVFISSNGILIPQEPITDEWEPTTTTNQVNNPALTIGGYQNVYEIEKNIELVQTFYPSIKTIAILTDNTYGGLSIKSLVKEKVKQFPNIEFVFLDGRDMSEDEISNTIDSLPLRSALIIGTWRVNKNEQYFLDNSLSNIVKNKKNLPIFTFSGVGMGSVAIGGFIPDYTFEAKEIVRQIDRFQKGNKDELYSITVEGHYRFDKQKLQKLGVQTYQLPANSILIDTENPQIKQYRAILFITLSVVLLLSSLLIFLTLLYVKNRNLRKELQKYAGDLIEARDKAEEGNKLKSAFLANMSHEIRTPLNAIVGFSQLMNEDFCTPEERSEYSNVISQNSEMLLTIISDILDISKMDSGKFELEFIEIDLRELCEKILQTTKHLRKDTIQYICAPYPKDITLHTDPHRLSQILINLITNANKFTEKGSITFKYELSSNKREVIFSITDTGKGILREHREKLFQRFEKLDIHSPGAGLGLAISQMLVNKLGGEIWLDSTYNEGARFCFTHPLKSK